ncbi:MAG TPA: ABC transporter ATP-binding protein [Bacillota bacterium]|jgi:ATP-binding cassette subfamily B protein
MTTIRRLSKYVFRYWPLLLGAAALVTVVSGLGLVTPWVTRWIIDTVLGGRQFGLLWVAIGAIVAASVLRGALTFAQRYSMEYLSQRVTYDLRNELYSHLQQLSFGFYDKAQTGQLMSRLTADVDLINRFLGFGMIQLLTNFITFLAILIILMTMNWRLTLLSTVALPFLAHAVFLFQRRVRPMFTAIQQQMAVLTSTLQENITGIRVVKAFAREGHEIEKFARDNRGYLDRNMAAVRIQAFFMPYMNFLTGLATTAILWFGGRAVIGGALTLGSFVAFNSYLTQLIMPVRMLGFLISLWERAAAAGQRVFEILDTKAEIGDGPGAVVMPRVKGRVRFDHVTFGYDPAHPVLRDISIDARPGQVIAVLGGTGSGKSSLINLIPRFYDVTAGSVEIDGLDIRRVKLDSLRRQIGVVSQEPFLFAATLRDNIAYGRAKATMDEVVRAAKTAQIHDFIVGLPEGYDTYLGERGVGLSGGQKQRVAIARAILIDARIIILDESTSSVDTQTEYLIQEAFREVMKGRTSFVIAQRLSTVRDADKIIVLDHGRIAEEGTHERLLALGGVYKAIYDLQFRAQEEEDPGRAAEGGRS